MSGIKNQIEIAVIGGGLIGMLTAYELTRKGFSVTVFEKSITSSESSWAGGGILSPLYPWRYSAAVNGLARESIKLYPSLTKDLLLRSGIDAEYHHCGMYILEDDLSPDAYQWLNEQNVEFEKKRQNWNHLPSKSYLFLKDIAQIRNPRFIKSVKLAIEKMGVTMITDTPVLDFQLNMDGKFDLSTKHGNWIAEKVVVCAGAWSAQLLKNLTTEIEIKPVRGQMLLYKAPKSFLSSIILASGKYIIPRLDGHTLVGSTMEDVGFDKSTTEFAYDEIKQFVADHCCELANYPIVRHWSGLRPGSPDGIPYIGEHPSISNLYINSGHFRNGVVMAPASAVLISQIVGRDIPCIDPFPYSIRNRKMDI